MSTPLRSPSPTRNPHTAGKPGETGASGRKDIRWSPNHIRILEWVETRTEGHARPQIPGLSPFRVDEMVADLVGKGLMKGVAVPRHPKTNVPAHWEPTMLTADGRRVLSEHRRLHQTDRAESWWARLLRLGR